MQIDKAFHELLRIGPRVTALPVIHGSGDFAWTVRDVLLRGRFDCLAVPLPESFASALEPAIGRLPIPSMIVQREFGAMAPVEIADAESSAADSGELDGVASFVPVDPCQPVIAALRTAISERIPRHYIDLETADYQLDTAVFPDPYALKKVPLPQFAASLLPFIPRPESAQVRQRVEAMAWGLKQLSIDYRNILFVCSMLHWPWIREAFERRDLGPPQHESVREAEPHGVAPESLYFMLGELPFITSLYEAARAELAPDDNLSIDGIKELLIAARQRYREGHRGRARRITPLLLRQMVHYIRNLTLINGRFTPDLVTVITAAKQMAGDGYALETLELARHYASNVTDDDDALRLGIGRAMMPDGDILGMKSRLPGPPVEWSSLRLLPKPDEAQQERWKQGWNPYSQCSWPPEDVLIENFRSAVFDRARQILGADLARTEKFTTSIRDGIDIRDTLRHWYEGEIYVKVLPPNRGDLDAAVMLFDSPADPRDYPWRTTWFAEHRNESTLAFFATDFREQPVGPGICLANYGGALFLFPPIMIADIWSDRRFDFASTLEERLIAATCCYSRSPHVALLSPLPPGRAWKEIARLYRKSLVHVPLSQFGDSTVQQLRMVHVLGGKQVRSYAAEFIRRV